MRTPARNSSASFGSFFVVSKKSGRLPFPALPAFSGAPRNGLLPSIRCGENMNAPGKIAAIHGYSRRKPFVTGGVISCTSISGCASSRPCDDLFVLLYRKRTGRVQQLSAPLQASDTPARSVFSGSAHNAPAHFHCSSAALSSLFRNMPSPEHGASRRILSKRPDTRLLIFSGSSLVTKTSHSLDFQVAQQRLRPRIADIVCQQHAALTDPASQLRCLSARCRTEIEHTVIRLNWKAGCRCHRTRLLQIIQARIVIGILCRIAALHRNKIHWGSTEPS